MKLIVGLGNPGPKYETTRHNVGFLAVDRLVNHFQSTWKISGPTKKSNGEIYSGQFGEEKILLVKPTTFMNLSGQCVAPLFKFYQCKPQDLIVLHDDFDVPLDAIRIKTGGGTGGHNGLKSIDAEIGKEANGYHRIRIGIDHPTRLGLPIAPVDYVLQAYSDEELKFLDHTLNQVVLAVEEILKGRIHLAMNQIHKKNK